MSSTLAVATVVANLATTDEVSKNHGKPFIHPSTPTEYPDESNPP